MPLTSGRIVPWVVLAGFLAIAGFFLATEHAAHLFGALSVALLALCLLLHVVHRRHETGGGGHAGHGGERP